MPEFEGPACEACDENAGTIRCSGGGAWLCPWCFGIHRVEGGGPCPDCAIELAKQGIY